MATSGFHRLSGGRSVTRRLARDDLRNTYSPWEELASLPDLELRREPIGGGRLGEYIHHLSLIRLEPAMPRRQARAVLCHELRHHQFGDVATFCASLNRWQEARADSAAARLLIDIHDLSDALLVHDQNLQATAVSLRVSVDMVEVRLKRLHPSERHLLARRLAPPWD